MVSAPCEPDNVQSSPVHAVCRPLGLPVGDVTIVSVQKFLIFLPLMVDRRFCTYCTTSPLLIPRATGDPDHAPARSESASAYCVFDSFEFVHLDRAKAIDLESQHGELHYQVVSIDGIHHTMVRVMIVIDSDSLVTCPRGNPEQVKE